MSARLNPWTRDAVAPVASVLVAVPVAVLVAVLVAVTAVFVAPAALGTDSQAWAAGFDLDSDGPFVHEQLLDRYGHLPTFPVGSVVGPTDAQRAARARGTDDPIVMGYVPYWVAPTNLPWDSVDIVAWFSVGMNADGSLGTDNGWGDEAALELIDAAHSVGAQVVLSTTRFGGNDVHALLSSPEARSNAIDNLVAAMLEGNGDGIDIDFEGLLYEDRPNIIAFVEELRADLDAAQPGSLLTMATPAIDWSGAWDFDVLAELADVLFIMGYAFSGSWSNPGPTAPLDADGTWGSRGLRWSVQDYLKWGGPLAAERVVLGLPLYGWVWESTDDTVPGTALSGGDDWAIFWAGAMDNAAAHGQGWDSISATAYSSWQDDGVWHQMFFETPDSVELKATMARDEGIAGFGFWALNYDEGDPALWDRVYEVTQQWGDGSDDDDDDDDDDTGSDDDDTAIGDDDDSAPDDDDTTGDDDDNLRPPTGQDPDSFANDGGNGCACSVPAARGLSRGDGPHPAAAPWPLLGLALGLGLTASLRRRR